MSLNQYHWDEIKMLAKLSSFLSLKEEPISCFLCLPVILEFLSLYVAQLAKIKRKQRKSLSDPPSYQISVKSPSPMWTCVLHLATHPDDALQHCDPNFKDALSKLHKI